MSIQNKCFTVSLRKYYWKKIIAKTKSIGKYLRKLFVRNLTFGTMKINIDKRKINISSNIKCVLSILVAFSFIITANAQMYLDQNYDLKAVKVISVLPIVINSSYGLESEVIANTLIEGMLKKKNLLVLPTQDISSNEANKLFNDSVANWDLINEIPVFTESGNWMDNWN